MSSEISTRTGRITSIDFLRGLVMVIMALDHVRMYFGYGTWYSEPTNLATTTPLLFFTRWITHFCAPVFVFLAGTSASLYGMRKANVRAVSGFLLSRGLWLIAVELVVVNFAWTFDITYSFHILQVIWAIGLSLVVLSALVFLPTGWILAAGALLVICHNLLDPVTAQGSTTWSLLWHILHQPGSVRLTPSHLVDFVYPVLPWIGLMALGYAAGSLYKHDFPADRRRRWLLVAGICATLLFILLRSFNLYGEPHPWQTLHSPLFSLMSFLNTTKYPPSFQFLLMTMGPALVLLATLETVGYRLAKPVLVFGRVPFFFYIAHLYVIHAAAMLLLVAEGRDWHEYIFSAGRLASGTLSNFGLGLGAVYLIWVMIVLLLYPLCAWYQKVREKHPDWWWLSYL